MYVWGVSDEGPENGCGPDLMDQTAGGGPAKQGSGVCVCVRESSKILSLQRRGLCVSKTVSDVLWKRKLQEKRVPSC